MRTEVHVHGSIFLCKGVRLSQVDQSMRPWLDYLDVHTIGDAHSLEREEPGISYDPKERVVNICWTVKVGRSFQSRLTEAFHNLGPLTQDASEVEGDLLSRGRRRRVLPDVHRTERRGHS